jgi:hypothetical protein
MDDVVISLYAFAIERGDVDACIAMLNSKRYGDFLREMPITKKWMRTAERKGNSVITSATVAYEESDSFGRWRLYYKPKKTKLSRAPSGHRHKGMARLSAKWKNTFNIKGFGIESRLNHAGKGVYKVSTQRLESVCFALQRETSHAPNEECIVCGPPEPWETASKCSMRRYAWCNRIRRHPNITEVVSREYDNTSVDENEIKHCRGKFAVSDKTNKTFVYPQVLPCYTKCQWKIQVAAPAVYRRRY